MVRKLYKYPIVTVVILLLKVVPPVLAGIESKAALSVNWSVISSLPSDPDTPFLNQPNEIGAERVVLVSDRSLYITGERVYFSACILAGSDKMKGEVSVVLYTEIITPDGKSIAKGKFPVENQKSTGYLEIPAEPVTGVYYLRAYTRIMRNVGPQSYSYLSIRIVNPYKNEVLGGNDTVTIQTSEAGDAPDWLEVTPAKDFYATGEEITITTKPYGGIPLMVNVSVIPKQAYSRNPVVLSKYSRDRAPSEMCLENRGVSISGVLKTSENGQPVANRRINLSVIGDGKDFMAMNSDEDGRFYFSLPALTGWRDLYLGTTGTGTQQARVFADNDFCSMPVNLPAPAFRLTDEERKKAVVLAGNARVHNAYRDSTLKTVTLPGRPFYGTPDQVLVLSKYVELPSLEEYFNELPGLVKVRSSGGRKYFKVTGMQPEMAIYDPLVLIDHVAVDNIEQILSASPSSINRIEMFNQPYLKGDILYGGIVSIISKRGDFAGINLPASGTFINYRFFNEVESDDFMPLPASPDARNTVYFGILSLSADGKYEPITFFTPATAGNYNIIMTMVYEDGSVSEYRRVIEVK